MRWRTYQFEVHLCVSEGEKKAMFHLETDQGASAEGEYFNDSKLFRSVRMAEQLALPTSDHGVAGSNPAGGKILPEPKRHFIA